MALAEQNVVSARVAALASSDGIEVDMDAVLRSVDGIVQAEGALADLTAQLVSAVGTEQKPAWVMIPAALHVLVSCERTVSALREMPHFDGVNAKYVLYGLLLHVMLLDGRISDCEEEILLQYSWVWKLLTFNLSTLFAPFFGRLW